MNVTLPRQLRLPLPPPTRAEKIRTQIVWPFIMVGFLSIFAANGMLRWEHTVIAGACLACYGPDRARRFVDLFMPMVCVAIYYDLQRFWGPYVDMTVHVSGPYNLEKALFGIPTATGRITTNELFDLHHWPWLDVVTAFPYLTYIFEAVALGAYLFFVNRDALRRLAWVFMGVNIGGMLTEMFFPVAPPWYVSQYGLGPAVMNIPASPGATIRFDQLTGTHLFEGFYGRSTDVFGAIPSLHVAYPLLVYFFARELKKPWLTWVTLSYTILMGFSAVYLQHHYIIDVFAGVAYAGVGYGIDRWIARWRRERDARAGATPLHPVTVAASVGSVVS
jgi:membrane-associated phospholipid phosphatase